MSDLDTTVTGEQLALGLFQKENQTPIFSFVNIDGFRKSNHRRPTTHKIEFLRLVELTGGKLMKNLVSQSEYSIPLLFLSTSDTVNRATVKSLYNNMKNRGVLRDIFHENFIWDMSRSGAIPDLNRYRIGRSVFEPYDANDILMKKKKWTDFKLLEDSVYLDAVSSKDEDAQHLSPVRAVSIPPATTTLAQNPEGSTNAANITVPSPDDTSYTIIEMDSFANTTGTGNVVDQPTGVSMKKSLPTTSSNPFPRTQPMSVKLVPSTSTNSSKSSHMAGNPDPVSHDSSFAKTSASTSTSTTNRAQDGASTSNSTVSNPTVKKRLVSQVSDFDTSSDDDDANVSLLHNTRYRKISNNFQQPRDSNINVGTERSETTLNPSTAQKIQNQNQPGPSGTSNTNTVEAKSRVIRDISPFSDSDSDDIPIYSCEPRAPPLPSQRPKKRLFRQAEQQTMIDWVVRRRGFDEIFGKELYVSMELAKICPGRTWQSLSNNFRKSIITNLKKFRMTEEHRKRFIRRAKLSGIYQK